MVRVSRGDIRSNFYKNVGARKIKAKQPERIKGRVINLFRDLHDTLNDGRLSIVVYEKCAKSLDKSLNERNKIDEGGFGSIFNIKLKNDKGVNEDIVVKVDRGKKISKSKIREINDEMLSEQKKADYLRNKKNKAINDGDLPGHRR